MIKNILSQLHSLLESSFLQEALFSLVEDPNNYATLLVVNHHGRYLTLSNEDHYIYLLPVASPTIIAEVREQAKYIFTRKKIVMQLVDSVEVAEFDDAFCFGITTIILQAQNEGRERKKISFF